MENSVLKNCRFHHVAISVKDYDKSVVFYTQGLGMKIYSRWEQEGRRQCFLDIGDGSYVELTYDESLNTNRDSQDKELLHFCLQVEDVDAAYRIAIDNGAEVVLKPFDHFLPAKPVPLYVRVALIKGLNGEVIEFNKFRD